MTTIKDWEANMRAYIDKFFVQKAKGMKSLDREVLIDYVRNLLLTQKHELKETLKSLNVPPYPLSDMSDDFLQGFRAGANSYHDAALAALND